MNLLQAILNAQNGGVVRQLAQNFGLGEDQAVSALSNLVPALSQGLMQNSSSGDGLQSLLSALGSGNHQRYVEDLSTLDQQETIQDGNGILGHLLGSKDVSRQVARQASAQSGVGEDILKRMLPVVATMVMGSLSKQAPALGLHNVLGGGETSGVLGMLSSFLDANQDGSVAHDVMGFVGKLFQKSGNS
jgi:hypothetical protein